MADYSKVQAKGPETAQKQWQNPIDRYLQPIMKQSIKSAADAFKKLASQTPKTDLKADAKAAPTTDAKTLSKNVFAIAGALATEKGYDERQRQALLGSGLSEEDIR